MKDVALRLDDVGASTKWFNLYSKHSWEVGPIRISGDWLFLKALPAFRGWGIYREMRAGEWKDVLGLLESRSAKLTVAVTAAWVGWSGELTPFPKRFPDQARVLKEGVEQGLIEIANHGLTHCVLEGKRFRPRLFDGNRRYHREFWEWLPQEVHEDHLARSQDILSACFENDIVTFVPPGHIYAEETVKAAERHGIRYLVGKGETRTAGNVVILNTNDTIEFHDREIVRQGLDWLSRAVDEQAGRSFCFLREMGERCVERMSVEGG